jgi:uracil-DNA glycosylase
MGNMAKSIRQAVEMEMMFGVKEIIVPQRAVSESSEEDISMEGLRARVAGCRLCGLADTRTKTVFGEGSENARLMFIGEAPGADEDEQGRPFVGRAGQLLTKIIESIGLKREEVFIGNILKCRPPGNRNPLPGEIEKCSPYLREQIKRINPGVICALGKFAAQTLLGTEATISSLRGRFHDYHGIKLMPTYHPAYLLRNSSGKKDVWEDMQAIARELGLKIPDKTRGQVPSI